MAHEQPEILLQPRSMAERLPCAGIASPGRCARREQAGQGGGAGGGICGRVPVGTGEWYVFFACRSSIAVSSRQTHSPVRSMKPGRALFRIGSATSQWYRRIVTVFGQLNPRSTHFYCPRSPLPSHPPSRLLVNTPRHTAAPHLAHIHN